MPIRILPKELTKRALKGPGALKQRPKISPAQPAPRSVPKKVNVFSGADEKLHKKPHSTGEGRLASIKKASKRWKEGTYKSEDYGDKSLHTQWKAERKARKKAMQKFQLGKRYNIGGRANLLEEMGRIDARKPPDAADRAEKRRVIGELNRGYKSGGAVLKGKKVGCQIK